MARGSTSRVCLIRMPNLHIGPRRRDALVYLSGALFAIGWWFFLDAVTLSAHAKPPEDAPYDSVPVHIRFPDWIPGLCSTIGMIIVNLIDKSRLVGDDDVGSSIGFSGMGGVAWKARLFLFLGFALMAGGLAGSTVLVLKYVIPDYQNPDFTYWGIANVLQSICIMSSASILWLAQAANDDLEYTLSI